MGVESGGTRSRTRFVRRHPFIFTHLYSSTKRFSKSIFGRLYYVERRLRAAASKALLRRSTYIYRERERERLPRLLRASLILLSSSSSSSSFHRSRARRFVDGLRRAPIVVVWHFNPKVFDDCIDFPFEFFRALNLALIASLLLSAFQRG